jgi:hypothetical protein
MPQLIFIIGPPDYIYRFEIAKFPTFQRNSLSPSGSVTLLRFSSANCIEVDSVNRPLRSRHRELFGLMTRIILYR